MVVPMTQQGSAPPPPPPGDPRSAGAPGIRTTRTAAAWSALGFGLLLLIVVLVFVLQNLTSVRTSFFGAKWTIPLGLDLLLAAILGGVIAFLLGGARMLQLRRAARAQLRGRHRS